MTRPHSDLAENPPIAPDLDVELEKLRGQLKAYFSVPLRKVPGLEADDLVQMTMLRVYRNMKSFRHDSSLRTWVFRIANNALSNALRDAKAQKRKAKVVSLDWLDDSEEKAPLQVRDQRDEPLKTILAEERTRLLWKTVRELPAKMSRCLTLSLRGFSPREIATLLKIEENTVKSHLQEGRKRLGPLLREHFDIPEPQGGTP